MCGVVARTARRGEELVLFADRVRVTGNVVSLQAAADGIGWHQAFQGRVAASDLVQPRQQILVVPGLESDGVGLCGRRICLRLRTHLPVSRNQGLGGFGRLG